jgi:hypothetical protein
MREGADEIGRGKRKSHPWGGFSSLEALGLPGQFTDVAKSGYLRSDKLVGAIGLEPVQAGCDGPSWHISTGFPLV